jgi:hypothetical protein
MKKLSNVMVFLVIALALILGTLACGAPTSGPASPSDSPGSDNSFTYAYDVGIEVSTETFTVVATIFDDMVNHTEINASGGGYMVNGTGAPYLRVWQDGKGLLPVVILSIDPEYKYLISGTFAVLKTSDLKVMGAPTGATIRLICLDDVEVLSPSYSGQVLTTDKVTHELDNCRMVTPEFKIK